ncbi:copper resistance CopC family protein, partial [Streptomyces sp. T21Q-yed]
MTPRRTLVLLVLTPLLYVLLGSPQASAHTELVTSSPANGAELKQAPDHLTLTFDEPVEPADVRVMTVDGDRLPVSRVPGHNGEVVRAALGHPADGSFAVVWSVVDEEDGHASSGRLDFGIAAPAAQDRGDEAV